MSAPDIKTPGELTDESAQALRDLILCLADSKRIIGIRYADWVLGAPELEANIAASSIAQDEWGHSRLLYALLKDFGDEPQQIEHGREPAEYCSIEAIDGPLLTWPDFVVTNAIVDRALTVQLEALTDSRYAPLRQRVQKQVEEERFHAGHGAAWLQRLGKASDESRAAVSTALAARWNAVLCWFGPDDHGARQKEEGLWDAQGGEVRARFLDRVVGLIERSGLDVPAADLDFSGWDARKRRANAAGPEPEAVVRARGDRNRAFLMD